MPDDPEQPAPDQPERAARPTRPTAGQTLGAMWLYTVLRFGMFLLLWGLLWVARVPGLLAAVIALALSVPLSFVLLRRQRERVAANLEQRVLARQAQQHDLDAKLAGEDPES
jgi:Flp pilus assembly protein TadB